jgi:hypothetical protein
MDRLDKHEKKVSLYLNYNPNLFCPESQSPAIMMDLGRDLGFLTQRPLNVWACAKNRKKETKKIEFRKRDLEMRKKERHTEREKGNERSLETKINIGKDRQRCNISKCQ